MWNSSYKHRGQFNWLNNNSSMLFFTQPCGLTKLNVFPLQDVLNMTHLCKGFQCSVHPQQLKYQVFTFYSCLFWTVRWKHAWGRTSTVYAGTRCPINMKELLASWLLISSNAKAYVSIPGPVFFGMLLPLKSVSVLQQVDLEMLA